MILKKIGCRFVTMNKTLLMLGPVLVATFYRCSTKEVFIKVLQSLQKTTVPKPLLNNVAACNFIKTCFCGNLTKFLRAYFFSG